MAGWHIMRCHRAAIGMFVLAQCLCWLTTAVWRMARVMVGKVGVPILTALPHPQLWNIRVCQKQCKSIQLFIFLDKNMNNFLFRAPQAARQMATSNMTFYFPCFLTWPMDMTFPGRQGSHVIPLFQETFISNLPFKMDISWANRCLTSDPGLHKTPG